MGSTLFRRPRRPWPWKTGFRREPLFDLPRGRIEWCAEAHRRLVFREQYGRRPVASWPPDAGSDEEQEHRLAPVPDARDVGPDCIPEHPDRKEIRSRPGVSLQPALLSYFR